MSISWALPVIAIFMASVASGAVGPLVVARRATYMAGAVSHSMLAGIGLSIAFEAKFNFHLISPFAGSILVAIAAALVFSHLSRKEGSRSDAVLSGVWSGGFAIGMLLMVWATGDVVELEEYLLGSVREVEAARLVQFATLVPAVAFAVWLGYNKLLACAFDRELAAIRGVNVRVWEIVFNVLTALTVAMLAYTVGILLAIAFLAIPAVAAGRITGRLPMQMVLAGVFTLVSGLAGLAAESAFGIPGSAIAVLAALTFDLLSHVATRN